jgi:predicted nucleic acid-binding protein
MLVDSNIIIYAVRAEDTILRPFFAQNLPKVSIISRIEVLGYHKLTDDVRKRLEALFNWLRPLPLTDRIVEKAIQLRQQRKLSLGDALIAGTALENRLTLVTRNIRDFSWIDGLVLLDPFHDPLPNTT